VLWRRGRCGAGGDMIGLLKTDYTEKDLSYEELIVNKETILNSSY
jgi:hypothetical protein